MCTVAVKIVRVYQDIIKVTNAENIQEFPKGVIDKALAGCRSIGKFKGHNKEFKQAITGPEGSFPFITVLNPDQVICRS